MRKLRLCAESPKGSWSPRFSIAKPKATPAEDERLHRTPFMSWFPTWKGGRRMVGLAHYFHVDMATLAEADPDCTEWDVDSTPFPYAKDDDVRYFVPDFVLRMRAGVRLVRLVHGPEVDETYDRRQRKEPALPEPRDGVTFERYTRAQLHRHPRLRASRDILYHRRRHLPQELPLQVAGMFAMRPFDTLGELHSRLGGTDETWFDVLSLVAQGVVEVDMDQQLGPEMPVRSCTERSPPKCRISAGRTVGTTCAGEAVSGSSGST